MTDKFKDFPICGMSNTYYDSNLWVCADWHLDWTTETVINDKATSSTPCKDANVNTLNNGDAIILIKDLKVKGGSLIIKGGTKIKNIRIAEDDHNIDCKING
jgi:protein PhnA